MTTMSTAISSPDSILLRFRRQVQFSWSGPQAGQVHRLVRPSGWSGPQVPCLSTSCIHRPHFTISLQQQKDCTLDHLHRVPSESKCRMHHWNHQHKDLNFACMDLCVNTVTNGDSKRQFLHKKVNFTKLADF